MGLNLHVFVWANCCLVVGSLVLLGFVGGLVLFLGAFSCSRLVLFRQYRVWLLIAISFSVAVHHVIKIVINFECWFGLLHSEVFCSAGLRFQWVDNAVLP